MPAQGFILLHWKRQTRVFLQNIEALKKQYNADAIHDLRVAVKKLRAYLKLMGLLNKDIDHNLAFEETEQLFNLLGTQRDIEMGILLLDKFEKKNDASYTLFRSQLQTALQQSAEWIQPALSDYDINTVKELTLHLQDELKNLDNESLSLKIKLIIEKEYKRSAKHIADLNHHTHQVRKLFKDIVYQSEICPKDQSPVSIPVLQIKKVLNKLGDWQDHEMFHKKVKHFRTDFIPSAREEFVMLKDLEKSIMAKKQALLQACKKELNQR